MLRPMHGVLQKFAAQIVDHEGRSSWLEKPPVSAVTSICRDSLVRTQGASYVNSGPFTNTKIFFQVVEMGYSMHLQESMAKLSKYWTPLWQSLLDDAASFMHAEY